MSEYQLRPDGEPTDEHLIENLWYLTQRHNQKPIITLETFRDALETYSDIEITEERLEERLDALTRETPMVVERIDVDGTPVYAGTEFAGDMYRLGLLEHRDVLPPTDGSEWYYTNYGTRHEDEWVNPEYPEHIQELLGWPNPVVGDVEVHIPPGRRSEMRVKQED